MSLGAAYAMKNKGRCLAHGTAGCEMCHGGKAMADGGEVDDSDAAIGRIMMKRMSRGGEVANDTQPIADSEPAQYDELVKDDDEQFHYTGANSGDEIGDPEEDEREKIGRFMRGRKDRNPRPA